MLLSWMCELNIFLLKSSYCDLALPKTLNILGLPLSGTLDTHVTSGLLLPKTLDIP
jgi:hypothetical protein